MAGGNVEAIKAASGNLRGTLAAELGDPAPAFSKDATQVLKFHGVYQQDDRDARSARAAEGLGRDHICMVRAAIPGGALTTDQYLVVDRLADACGDATLRVTTRQGIQYHFARKGDLRPLIRTLNRSLVTTLAACGDVVRNIVACPAPLPDRGASAVQRLAAELAGALRPRTEAYWQLWVDGERVASAEAPSTDDEVDALYGPTFLPRKFKIGLAHPGDNCVDVYTHDIGLVPHLQAGRVDAVTILVGGGLGMTHNKPETYPRLADPLGSVHPADLVATVTAIVELQRDHGDRTNRKHARMKYVVAEWGVDRFRAEVERRVGRPLDPPSPLSWEQTSDHLGWGRQADGRWFCGVPVPSGRIADGQVGYRSGLRTAVARHAAGVRFTPRQDVLLVGIADADRPAVEQILTDHRIPPVETLAPVQRHALACPALPTCGLALTEAERVLPDIVESIHAELDALGLAAEGVHVRVTGCPNGCARPYSSEVGVVGRGKDRYTIFVGGNAEGTRLASPYADQVAAADVAATLRPLLAAWHDERDAGETFGDFCHRTSERTLACL